MPDGRQGDACELSLAPGGYRRQIADKRDQPRPGLFTSARPRCGRARAPRRACGPVGGRPALWPEGAGLSIAGQWPSRRVRGLPFGRTLRGRGPIPVSIGGNTGSAGGMPGHGQKSTRIRSWLAATRDSPRCQIQVYVRTLNFDFEPFEPGAPIRRGARGRADRGDGSPTGRT